MIKDQKKLAELLFAKGGIAPDRIKGLIKSAKTQNKSLEEIALEGNYIDEEKLAQLKAELLNISYIDLQVKSIEPNVLKNIAQEVSENYQMIAFEVKGKNLSVAMVDPQNFKAIEALEYLGQKNNLEIKQFLCSKSSFKAAFNSYSVLVEEAKEVLAGVGQESVLLEQKIEKGKSPREVGELIKSAPVSKMVIVIIKHAIEERSSDIHIEPGFKESRVRYRIDGVLKTSLLLPKYIHAAIISRIKVLANLKLDETRIPQDGRIRLEIDGRYVDFRVSTLPVAEGEKAVLRILDTSTTTPSLSDLGLNSIHAKIIKENVKRPHGLFLLTGPTGSGKTTTLYTILHLINKEGTNIITLEDPVEYYMEGINQSHIRPEIGYSFASGLRSILRQDPNVIMLGEIRDKESAELVIHASLTGHMVFSTLHTNDAIGAIPRLIDMGVEPFLLSTTINFVMAQRLARRICKDCKIKINLPPKIESSIKQEIQSIPSEFIKEIKLTTPLIFYKGKGCTRCSNTGYKGRVAASEIIDVNDELREAINKGSLHGQEIDDILKKQNFITIRQDGLIKALEGFTTLDEVMRISQI